MKNALEWIKVVGPLLISWPVVGLLAILLFHSPMSRLFDRFIEVPGSTAEIGPVKISMGTVLPPQYRESTTKESPIEIDLSEKIGEIRDTGPEATTVAVAVAYAMQAAIAQESGEAVRLSVRSIYQAAKKYDDFPGESYEGTSIIGALKGMVADGAWPEAEWPYQQQMQPTTKPSTRYKISDYKAFDGVDEIVANLLEGKVVVATIAVTTDFDVVGASGQTIVKLPLTERGMKAVAIVGYNSAKAEFKYANDWGTNWGAKGFGFIRDSDLIRILRNAYSLEM